MNAPHARPLTLLDRFNQKVFNAICGRSLIYNTCWEDPAVDRKALNLGPNDTVLAITSAGCNVLDYALLGPKRIHAVDANPRQTALLELKLAAIRCLDYEDFFALFGRGHHDDSAQLYCKLLRASFHRAPANGGTKIIFGFQVVAEASITMDWRASWRGAFTFT